MLLPLLQKPSNLLHKKTAVSFKLAEVFFFPSLNINSQTERQLPCLITSQYSKTVAVCGLHHQATVERERELHAEPVLLLVKWAETPHLPPIRCHVWTRKKLKTKLNTSEEWDRIRKTRNMKENE